MKSNFVISFVLQKMVPHPAWETDSEMYLFWRKRRCIYFEEKMKYKLVVRLYIMFWCRNVVILRLGSNIRQRIENSFKIPPTLLGDLLCVVTYLLVHNSILYYEKWCKERYICKERYSYKFWSNSDDVCELTRKAPSIYYVTPKDRGGGVLVESERGRIVRDLYNY